MPTTTLFLVAAAGLLNVWLMIRCGQIRAKAKILHGDGGNALLQRRMRAHLNFAENAPIIILLFLTIELAGSAAGWVHGWLAPVALIFIIARIFHALGMDADEGGVLRNVGIAVTMLLTIILAGVAVYTGYVALTGMQAPSTIARTA